MCCGDDDKKKCCEQPDKLQGKPGDCSEAQKKECHGDAPKHCSDASTPCCEEEKKPEPPAGSCDCGCGG